MTMSPRKCVSLALVAAFLAGAGVSTAQSRRGRRGGGDFDRRASMALRGAPNQLQLDALTELRDELGGSLLDSIDTRSGVTRSLFNPVGKLTAPNAGDPVDVALDYARDNLSLLGLADGDLDEIEVCDSVYSAVTGATHVYLCQRFRGLEVFNAQLHVNVSRDGAIVSVNNSFVPAIQSVAKSRLASIEAEDACLAAADHLGIGSRRARRQGRRLLAEELSTEPIDPSLVWMPMGRSVKLAWRFEVHTTDRRHVYDMTVDAEPGRGRRSRDRVMTRFDRVSPGLYEVYPVPIESPSHAPVPDPDDGRSIVVDPDHATASPLGWHDDGTQTYQIMRGNNVHAYDDRNADHLPPAVEPDCGPGLECSFPLDLGLGEDAVSGGPWSTFPTNGFQIPAVCLAGPRIVNPPNLAVLDGRTVTFDWTADGEPVDEWLLEVGTTRGDDDIYASPSLDGATLAHTVDVLPVDGSQVFVRLNYRIGTEWAFRDAFYTADLATPEVSSPAPGDDACRLDGDVRVGCDGASSR